jgi:hypothetical protein
VVGNVLKVRTTFTKYGTLVQPRILNASTYAINVLELIFQQLNPSYSTTTASTPPPALPLVSSKRHQIIDIYPEPEQIPLLPLSPLSLIPDTQNENNNLDPKKEQLIGSLNISSEMILPS